MLVLADFQRDLSVKPDAYNMNTTGNAILP